MFSIYLAPVKACGLGLDIASGGNSAAESASKEEQVLHLVDTAKFFIFLESFQPFSFIVI